MYLGPCRPFVRGLPTSRWPIALDIDVTPGIPCPGPVSTPEFVPWEDTRDGGYTFRMVAPCPSLVMEDPFGCTVAGDSERIFPASLSPPDTTPCPPCAARRACWLSPLLLVLLDPLGDDDDFNGGPRCFSLPVLETRPPCMFFLSSDTDRFAIISGPAALPLSSVDLSLSRGDGNFFKVASKLFTWPGMFVVIITSAERWPSGRGPSSDRLPCGSKALPSRPSHVGGCRWVFFSSRIAKALRVEHHKHSRA